MELDKLSERKQGNLKALEDANASLDSLFGKTGRTSSGQAIQAVLDFLEIPFLADSTAGTIKDTENYLESKGIPCIRYTLTGEWWKKASGPILASDSEGNLVALLPTSFGMRCAASGKKVNAAYAGELDGEALKVAKPLPSRALSMKDLYRFILKCIPKSDWIAITLFCLLATLLNMLVPVANKILFNDVIPSGAAREILPICSLLLGAGLSGVLLGVCNNFIIMRVKDKVNATVQPALMARLLFLPSSFFKSYSSADLSIRVLSVNKAYQLLTSQVLTVAVTGVFAGMYVLIAFLYAKELIWVVTFVFVVTIILSYFEIRACIKDYSDKIPNSLRTQDFSQSAILGIHKIKNNRAESRVYAQWAKRYSKSVVMSSDSSFFLRYRKAIGTAILTIGPLLAYFVAWSSGTALSDYMAFTSAFGIMISAMDIALRSIIAIAMISPHLSLVKPILEAVPETGRDLPGVASITGSIDLNHISFIYNPKAPKVLDDVNLHIPAGQSVGIVGSSGCGKSTLMRIMMGFEKPSSGSVFYGQYNVADINMGSLRQYVGYCPQNLQIFPGTIEDNIRMADRACSEEALWEAADAACIGDDIRKMPAGMHTLLGEGGSGLSGGQCQRLLIARSLLSHPKVLFLDEATSALDNITQKSVSDNISAMGCTRIMIAHRLSTVMNCDRIVVIDKGKVIEDGDPKELLSKKGFFYTLCSRQM